MSPGGIGIVEFMSGKVFLVTGATGFLAKVLIEKITRTVPNVGKIYLLIRAKDEESAVQRLKTEIINKEIFKVLQQRHGRSYETYMLSKLIPIVGNVCEANLGMEPHLADQMANEVEIIINLAGNTKLDDRYDDLLDTNTLGPSRLLSFAKSCKKIKLFLHVSTAYVNGERQGVIMEKPLYMGDSIARERAFTEGAFPLLHVEDELKIILEVKKSQTQMVSQKMKDLGLKRANTYGWQNAYMFTKAMGEMMIESHKDDVPVVIVRPSIVESTYMDPFPGWIQGIRVMDPVILYYARGDLTGFPVDGKGIIDIVPADMAVNAILAAAVKHARMNKPGLNVYHVSSSVVNPLKFQDLYNYIFEYFDSSPYMDLEWKPIKVERMKLLDSLVDFDSHIQAEAIEKNIDAMRLQKWLKAITHLATLYEPYNFYAGRFDNSNTQTLLEEMSQEEKMNFGFEVRNIDWRDYWCNIHIPGLLTYVIKGRSRM